jgi:hypothetical protein
MAQLSSPGVSVTVIDESFYTPAAPGTVPLIIVASEESKMNSAGTGIAPGTLKANAGKVYLLTSQADLGATFGVPYFQTDASNNPVNAGELNEYGLQAAYSFLGVSNRAYVVRADLNTEQMIGSAGIPYGAPEDGTLWWDTIDTAYGVFEWDGDSASKAGGQTFSNQKVKVINGSDSTYDAGSGKPKASFGKLGDYAIVALQGTNGNTSSQLYFKKYNTAGANQSSNAGAWVAVGSTEWALSWPAVASNNNLAGFGTSISPSGDVVITASVANGHVVVTAGNAQPGQYYTDGTDHFTIGAALSGTSVGVLTNGTTYSQPPGSPNTKGTNGTYTGVTQLTSSGSGTGAAFTITLTGGAGTYNVGTNVTITMTTPGQGYQSGDSIQIAGAGIGGGGTLSFVLGGAIDSTYLVTSPSAPTISANTFTHPGASADVFTINGYQITGVTNADAIVSAINNQFAGHILAANFSGILQIYLDGSDGYTSVTLTGYTSTSNIESWHKVGIVPGTYSAPELQLSPHYNLPNFAGVAPTGSVWVKTTSVNLGANWLIKKYSSATASFTQQTVNLYNHGPAAIAALDLAGGGINLSLNSIYVDYNTTDAVFTIKTRAGVGPTTATSAPVTASTFTAGLYEFTVQESQVGTAALTDSITVSFTATGATGDATAFAEAVNSTLVNSNVSAIVNANNSVTLTHALGGDIYLVDQDNMGTIGPAIDILFSGKVNVSEMAGVAYGYIVSLWQPADSSALFYAQSATPDTTPADGTLWYDTNIDADILVHNGYAWVGYQYAGDGVDPHSSPYHGTGTDANGPLISALAPTVQSTGSPLAHGDLWIDTSNVELFPAINRWNGYTKKWVSIDVTDHTTPDGIIFQDARWSADPTDGFNYVEPITRLLTSDYVDADAPDPALYPKGTLLWNLRRSGFNVKKFVKNYVDVNGYNVRQANESQSTFYPHAWVSQAANTTMGVGQFGRHAQRAVVLQAIEALIESNQQIRDTDSKGFNLISCPGYLETLSSLISLNTDRGESAFIIADAPARLTPDATTLNNWGNNVAGAAIDGDQALIATNSYAAVYYPWGYTQDLLGNNIVVPPSHIMLRTIALSDNVSYPWFAPAGVRRGGVTNAASVGYVDGQTGEFITVALNQGQRDTLASIHVNPITYMAGTGLVCYGQYTRQLIASSLDRINVARLVIYLRHQLNVLAKPFVFEPNDQITRNEIKQAVEKLLLELTGQRALYDYLVVCDTSNNTPARIDRSELWVDIAIEPVKAVEFIYIPMRLENTGGIKLLGK